MDTVRKTRYESYAYEACPVEATLEMMGGKGKGMILYHLISGTKRFNELKRLLIFITPRMLTKQLRELEMAGLVHRKVYAEVPPKVEYSLTDAGQSLVPILLMLKSWGKSMPCRYFYSSRHRNPDAGSGICFRRFTDSAGVYLPHRQPSDNRCSGTDYRPGRDGSDGWSGSALCVFPAGRWSS